MRVHLTAATKMWLLTSLAFFYLIIQYHVSNTWSLPATGSIAVQENEIDSSRRLWLKDVIGDTKMAENLQNLIGEKSAQDLANRIGQHMQGNSCAIRGDETPPNLPPIYIVTPTYRRPEQRAELTRLSQTLMHVKSIYWLLIEDAKEKSVMISEFLNKTGIRYIHLNAESVPRKYKGSKPRGVASRIKGLKWIRENAHDGVLYFADDDNTYDLELFNEMRYTKKVSMWPVGLVTQTGVSSPIVKNGELIDFYDGWKGGRKFPVDMASFAVNIKFLKTRPKATMAYRLGYEEDTFLQSLAPLEPRDIELKADNCTKILVWHTQTKKNHPSQGIDRKKYANTNLIELKKILV